MKPKPNFVRHPRLSIELLDIFVDSEVQGEGGTGLSAVIVDDRKLIHRVLVERAGLMNCHEAEYAALKMALRAVRRMRPRRVRVFSDNPTVVQQMRRYVQINAYFPKDSGIEMVELLRAFPQISFCLLDGQVVRPSASRLSRPT
jgi:ribonuclease HI